VEQLIYRPSNLDGALRQGEIITDFTQVIVERDDSGSDTGLSYRLHPYVIVLTQDCDLDLDYRARNETVQADKEIPGILFCEVMTAERMFRKVKGSDLWKRIRGNNDPRYQFLTTVSQNLDAEGTGLPELAIDFKRYFTVPPDEVHHRLQRETSYPDGRVMRAIRRAVMESPYLEHLSTRFAQYFSRIALPGPHQSDPVL